MTISPGTESVFPRGLPCCSPWWPWWREVPASRWVRNQPQTRRTPRPLGTRPTAPPTGQAWSRAEGRPRVAAFAPGSRREFAKDAALGSLPENDPGRHQPRPKSHPLRRLKQLQQPLTQRQPRRTTMSGAIPTAIACSEARDQEGHPARPARSKTRVASSAFRFRDLGRGSTDLADRRNPSWVSMKTPALILERNPMSRSLTFTGVLAWPWRLAQRLPLPRRVRRYLNHDSCNRRAWCPGPRPDLSASPRVTRCPDPVGTRPSFSLFRTRKSDRLVGKFPWWSLEKNISNRKAST